MKDDESESSPKGVTMHFFKHKAAMVAPDEALPGRQTPGFDVPAENIVLGTPQTSAAPEGYEEVWFGTGCFWGAEEFFWDVPGVWTMLPDDCSPTAMPHDWNSARITVM